LGLGGDRDLLRDLAEVLVVPRSPFCFAIAIFC